MDKYAEKRLLHTPEGVRDIYGRELLKKLTVQDKLMHTFASFGYKNIQTPVFEFFDVFGSEIGTTRSNELYKFFDKEGNTLVQDVQQNILWKKISRFVFLTAEMSLPILPICRVN